jgi:hypothetical protein
MPYLQAQKMNNKSIDKILKTSVDSIQGSNGFWQFLYKDRLMILLTDESNNRMRVVSPVIEFKDLTKELMLASLAANFHTALDVKYALSEEVLWSVFIHPLKELSDDQLKNALLQVYNAAENFGTTFSSTDLVFPGSEGEQAPFEEKAKEKKM